MQRSEAQERAAFYAAIADTHARGEEALDAVRHHRARHVESAESLAVERRILREDFRHWGDGRA